MKRRNEPAYNTTSVLAAAAIVCFVIIGISVFINSKQFKIEFVENAEVSVNESADNYQFIKSIENGRILTDKTLIDTSRAGEKNITLTVKPAFGSEMVVNYSVLVVDRESPVISFFPRLETGLGCEIDLLSGVSAADNSGESIVVTVEGSYDLFTVGEYTLKYVAVDPSGNRTEEAFILAVTDNDGPHIICADRLQTDLGVEIDLLKDVSAADDSGESIVVTVEGTYDFNAVGEYKLKYVAVDPSGNKTEKDLILSVADNESPVITFKSRLETTEGKKIDLLKGVSAFDNSGADITVTVEGSYDFNTAGEYKLKYVAVDPSGNRTEEEFTLLVKEVVTEPPVTTSSTSPETSGGQTETNEPESVTFTTSKGFSGIIKDGITYIDGYLIANKTYSLPKSYGNGLTSETKSNFNKMAAAAKEDGLDIYIVSGFRSYTTQTNTYNNYVKRDGAKEADTYSARPGHSEHQSGLAFDLNSVKNSFANTKEAAWLSENCYKYGFILRYPKGKTNETGYIYEPWHFRYVGEELAAKLYNNGDWITMEDYFGITSAYAE